jgi:hypothetical protein
VQVTEVGDALHTDFVRGTAARVVGQPPTVSGPDEVETGDHGGYLLARETINQTPIDLSVRARFVKTAQTDKSFPD